MISSTLLTLTNVIGTKYIGGWRRRTKWRGERDKSQSARRRACAHGLSGPRGYGTRPCAHGAQQLQRRGHAHGVLEAGAHGVSRNSPNRPYAWGPKEDVRTGTPGRVFFLLPVSVIRAVFSSFLHLARFLSSLGVVLVPNDTQCSMVRCATSCHGSTWCLMSRCGVHGDDRRMLYIIPRPWERFVVGSITSSPWKGDRSLTLKMSPKLYLSHGMSIL